MTIGQRLAAYRRTAGFSQGEVARRLMVIPQAVSKWECDNGTPDTSLLLPIANLCGVSTDSLPGAGENAGALAEAIASLDDYHTGTTRERYERCRALLRAHPNDGLLLANCLELTFMVLYHAETDERDRLVADAEFPVSAMRSRGVPTEHDARIRSGMARIYGEGVGDFARAEREITCLPNGRYTRARLHGMMAKKQGKTADAIADFRESFTDSLIWMLWDLELPAACYRRENQEDMMDNLYMVTYGIIFAVYANTDCPYPVDITWQMALARRAQQSAREGHQDEAYGYLDAYMTSVRMSIQLHTTGKINHQLCRDPIACSWLKVLNEPYVEYDYARKRYVDTKYILKWHAFDSLRQEDRFATYEAECETWKERQCS